MIRSSGLLMQIFRQWMSGKDRKGKGDRAKAKNRDFNHIDKTEGCPLRIWGACRRPRSKRYDEN